MFYYALALALVFLLGFASGLPWGALWATWRRTSGPMPWTDVGGRPLPIRPGEEIRIDDLMRGSTRRTIDKEGETAVPPTEDLGTKVGDRLGPDV